MLLGSCLLLSLALAVGGAPNALHIDASNPLQRLHRRVDASPNQLIVDFRHECEGILHDSNSTSTTELEVELVHAKYAASVQDIYLKKFLSLVKTSKNTDLLCRDIVNEFRLVIEASTPSAFYAAWLCEGYVAELAADLQRLCDEQQTVANQQRMYGQTSSPSRKWRRRLKWIGSQALLLAINFLQGEWHRRSVRRATERRLAEVPEFPLL